MNPTLVVLAAGIGNRYGGLKQVDPVGPGGETIMDYSIYDAVRSGFGKIVFVIRKEMEKDFRQIVSGRFETKIPVEYVFQDRTPLPPGRKKPWGTGHAVLVAEEKIDAPVAVINADDFYGMRSLQRMADFLRTGDPDVHPPIYAMVGYVLHNTLSDFGTVSRGICRCGGESFLVSITEVTGIGRNANGAISSNDGTLLSGDELVSMNLWGFAPSIFAHIRRLFEEFMKSHGASEKDEFYIPTAINALVASGEVRMKVLPSPDPWFGITYREDKPLVTERIRSLIEQGEYPHSLWS